MSGKTPEIALMKDRLSKLEEDVKRLLDWRVNREAEHHLLCIGQRVTNRLLKLGPDKVDARMIAALSAAVGVDVLPIKRVRIKRKSNS